MEFPHELGRRGGGGISKIFKNFYLYKLFIRNSASSCYHSFAYRLRLQICGVFNFINTDYLYIGRLKYSTCWKWYINTKKGLVDIIYASPETLVGYSESENYWCLCWLLSSTQLKSFILRCQGVRNRESW
jgi:hypothetical protein